MTVASGRCAALGPYPVEFEQHDVLGRYAERLHLGERRVDRFSSQISGHDGLSGAAAWCVDDMRRAVELMQIAGDLSDHLRATEDAQMQHGLNCARGRAPRSCSRIGPAQMPFGELPELEQQRRARSVPAGISPTVER